TKVESALDLRRGPAAMTNTRRQLSNILIWIIILIATAWVLAPFYWAISTSFKEHLAIVSQSAFVPWLQYEPTLVNLEREISSRGPELIKGMTNSMIISIGATVISVSLGTLAGY